MLFQLSKSNKRFSTKNQKNLNYFARVCRELNADHYFRRIQFYRLNYKPQKLILRRAGLEPAPREHESHELPVTPSPNSRINITKVGLEGFEPSIHRSKARRLTNLAITQNLQTKKEQKRVFQSYPSVRTLTHLFL